MHFRPIKVVDIELSVPLTDIVCSARYGALKALLRLHGQPIGYMDLPLEAGICRAATIHHALFAHHAYALMVQGVAPWLSHGLPATGLPNHKLVEAPAPAAEDLPFITVAVCTRDRPEDLARCLAAITDLDYPEYEVVVVDNAPRNSATAQMMRERFEQFRYVCEERPGLDWARNRAFAEARGEIVAYTDDDVIVDGGWLRALAQAFRDQTVMAVTGLVVPFELETEPQLLFEQNGGFGRGFTRKRFCAHPTDVSVGGTFAWAGMFGTGANMAYRRALFAQIGGFDPALDVGTCTNGGGDIEMFFRVIKEGHTIVYEPAAFVRHRHRRDRASLARQIANNGVGFAAYLMRTAIAYPEERRVIATFSTRWFVGWLLRRVVASLLGRDPFPRDMLISEAWGFLIGLGRYQKARRIAAALATDTPNPRTHTLETTLL